MRMDKFTTKFQTALADAKRPLRSELRRLHIGACRRPQLGDADFEGVGAVEAVDACAVHPTPPAAAEAAMRADEFVDQGNIGGQRLWMRIMQAIEELQRERPRDGEGVH